MDAFQAHPVPQNVTNFEFHLVGDMTLKQFGYLGAGLGMAYLIFVILAVPAPYIAWPLIILFAASGAAFAFLPIQERPLDHWLAAFLKAISKPTKLKYESKVLPVEDPLFSKRLNFYLTTHKPTEVIAPLPQVSMGVRPPTPEVQPQNRQAPLETIVSKAPPPLPLSPKPLPPVINGKLTIDSEKEKTDSKEVSNLSENEQLKKTVELAQEAQKTQSKIVEVEKQLSQIKSTAAQPGTDPSSYVGQFESVLSDLQKLNEKASSLSHDLAVLSKAQVRSGPIIAKPHEKGLATKPVKALSLTTFANVINGIVTDSKGSYIEGAVVVAHDKQGLPVRALKSNKLGQFIAATPLPNGVYTISVEKEGMMFDSVQVELFGKVLNPVVLSAKKLDPIIR